MQIHLRYCAAWNYEPRAVSLAAKILTQYKQQLQALELQPSSGGCFELSADGQPIYSKLATGEFPDEDALVREIGQRLASQS
jgi:selenoprotein W-related protein